MNTENPAETDATLLIFDAGAVQRDQLPTDGRVLIVEADDKRAETLTEWFADRSDVEVLSAAIGSPEVEGVLHRFNLPRLNSLSAPDGLFRLMPGAKLIGTEKVTMVPMPELISRLPRLTEGLRLSIEVPGGEEEILSGLEETGILSVAAEVQIACPALPLYKRGMLMDSVIDWMTARDFDHTDLDDSDPDWPRATFRADPRLRTLQQTIAKISEQLAHALRDVEMLRSKAQSETSAKTMALSEKEAAASALKELQDKFIKAQAREAELLAEADQSARGADAAIAVLEASVVEAKATAQRAKEAAEATARKAMEEAAERTAATLQTLTQERDAADNALKDLQDKFVQAQAREAELLAEADQSAREAEATIATLQASLVAAKKEAEEVAERTTASLQTLTRERDAAKAAETQAQVEAERSRHQASEELEAINRECKAAKAEEARAKEAALISESRLVDARAAVEKARADAGQDVAQAQREVEKARADLAFQMRLEGMNRIDTDDLRQQLRDSERRRLEIEDLLRKLTPKLERAAQEYHELQRGADTSHAVSAGPTPSAATATGNKKSKKKHKTLPAADNA